MTNLTHSSASVYLYHKAKNFLILFCLRAVNIFSSVFHKICTKLLAYFLLNAGDLFLVMLQLSALRI